MANFSKVNLSGSTGGQAIKLTATASTGNTIHSTGTSSTILDEVWIYAYNGSSTTTTLTIQYGGTTAVDNDIKVTLNAQAGLTLVVPGLLLAGTGSVARTIYAYASTANVVTVSGYVNRIQ